MLDPTIPSPRHGGRLHQRLRGGEITAAADFAVLGEWISRSRRPLRPRHSRRLVARAISDDAFRAEFLDRLGQPARRRALSPPWPARCMSTGSTMPRATGFRPRAPSSARIARSPSATTQHGNVMRAGHRRHRHASAYRTAPQHRCRRDQRRALAMLDRRLRAEIERPSSPFAKVLQVLLPGERTRHASTSRRSRHCQARRRRRLRAPGILDASIMVGQLCLGRRGARHRRDRRHRRGSGRHRARGHKLPRRRLLEAREQFAFDR